MPLSNNLGQYLDIQPVLDRALEMGGARYQLLSRSAAFRWRARAYMFRTLLLRLDAEAKANYPGVAPSTPYDCLTIRVEDGDAVIKLTNVPEGLLSALDGKGIEKPKAEVVEDELLESAKAFAAELEGSDEGN